jgi:hypothetical protein
MWKNKRVFEEAESYFYCIVRVILVYSKNNCNVKVSCLPIRTLYELQLDTGLVVIVKFLFEN